MFNEAIDQKEKIYSVTEITRDIKSVLESNFQKLWVEGEISNLKTPSSGHAYFTLKDAGSQIPAVLFRNSGTRVKFQITDGIKVLVYAAIGLYEKQGKYQLNVVKIEPKGVGALQLAFEQLKKKLYSEGLFDPAGKKPVPFLPQKIGIVTSSTGAAIRDILNIINRRFSNVYVLIDPVRVQGDSAAFEIASAVDRLNEMNEVDVIIVTRGGGSLEDLWAFNEEPVARAIFRSKIPVISAVGHEIDYTISDFTADLRCPTPSAAAELVIGKKSELINEVKGLEEKLNYIVKSAIQNYGNRIRLASENRFFKDPKIIVREYQQQVDQSAVSLHDEMGRLFELKNRDYAFFLEKLEALSPLNVLKRGYSVTLRNNDVVKSARAVKKGDIVTTRVRDGRFTSKVIKNEESEQ
ncbi:exodeoxyribonuclease VII large subunit [Candidatus Auribacterota bacterium]